MGGVVSRIGRLFSKPPRAPPRHLQQVAQILCPPPPPPPPPPLADPLPPPAAPLPPPPQAQAPPPRQVKKESPEERIIREARQQIGVDCIKHYNFAVTGQTGVGKSSFVNAILSLEDNAACDVGEVETTQKIRSYSNTKWPSLKLWDIPGAGTPNHPANTYFEDKQLYVFDAILILTSDRFLDVDFHILRSARKFKTPCVFVRAKCDIAVESRAKREKVNALEASQRFRAEVSCSFQEGLANAGLNIGCSSPPGISDPRLYFISNKYLSGDEYAYAICDKRTRAWDCSLCSMDEQALIDFVLDAAKLRA